jgi:hypothetical protein
MVAVTCNIAAFFVSINIKTLLSMSRAHSLINNLKEACSFCIENLIFNKMFSTRVPELAKEGYFVSDITESGTEKIHLL